VNTSRTGSIAWGNAGAAISPEEHFGRKVAARLDTTQVGGDFLERLRVARQQAVQLARVRRLALVPASAAQTNGQGTLTAGTSWWWRWSTLLPVIALVAGFYGIEAWQENTQIRAAAEIDALLLSDDVPVDGYSDPGFIEFLKESRR
jgi:Protein of unknown function (DUF3619)